MIQVYNPNLSVPAVRGWCLKYIDDAGDAPNRTATARYSWSVEYDAGRISTLQSPDGLWVVGFIDFTAGAYTTYGHVFFMKKTGSTYLIYDSEVASGTRKPYTSLNELLAWFGAYRPVYTGWSTDCDGRKYVMEEDDMSEVGEVEFNNLYIAMFGPMENNPPSEYDRKRWIGKETNTVIREMEADPRRGAWLHYIDDLKKAASQPTPDSKFELINEPVYIKK